MLYKTDPNNIDRSTIQKAVQALKSGKLIIFPTETVYGLGCDPKNPRALKKMFLAKKRSFSKPFQLLIGNLRQTRHIAKKIPKNAEKLIKASWPGPLTLVVAKRNSVPDLLTAGLPTVGIRMPDHPVALALIKAFKSPLAATSANISGKKAPKTARQAVKDLKNYVEIVLDGGKTRLGTASKVVDLSSGKKYLLR